MTYLLYPDHIHIFDAETGERIDVVDWLYRNNIPFSWCGDEWARWILVEEGR